MPVSSIASTGALPSTGSTVFTTAVTVSVVFADAQGNPLPPECRVAIYPQQADASAASLVASGSLAAASSFTFSGFAGATYRAQFSGNRAPVGVVLFVAPSSTAPLTVTLTDYISPSLASDGFTQALAQDMVRGFLDQAAHTSGISHAMFIAPVAAALAAVEAQLRAIVAGARLESARGYFLTTWIADFFGSSLPQLVGEPDLAYIAHAEAAFQATYARLDDLNAIVQGYYKNVTDGAIAHAVFDKRSDPKRAAFYGLLDGDVAIVAYYPPAVVDGWFLGRGALGVRTFLLDPNSFVLSTVAPFPDLGGQLTASTAEGIRLVYIQSHGE